MLVIQFFQKFCYWLQSSLSRRVKKLHNNLLFRWVLFGKSKPMYSSQKSALVFAPHQDDETLGCGGIIAIKREQKTPVSVVFITDGQASHLDHPSLEPMELGKIRKQEALTALDILGVEKSNIYFLDEPDSQLAQITSEKREKLLDKLIKLLQTINPQEVFITYRQDISSDHETAYALIREAVLRSEIKVEIFQYPIWQLWKPQTFDFQSSELSNAYRLSIRKVLNKKKQALAVYKSQYLPLDNWNRIPLPIGFLERFSSGYEIFFKI